MSCVTCGWVQMPTLILWSTCIGNSYYDIMHHSKKPFYLKGSQEDSNIMDAYLMHSVYTWLVLFLFINMYMFSTTRLTFLTKRGHMSFDFANFLAVVPVIIHWSDHILQLNHIFRSKDLMIKNEKKLAKSEGSMESKSVDDDAFRDRGFTRPKVYSSAFIPCNYEVELCCSVLVASVHCMTCSLILAWSPMSCLIPYYFMLILLHQNPLNSFRHNVIKAIDFIYM